MGRRLKKYLPITCCSGQPTCGRILIAKSSEWSLPVANSCEHDNEPSTFKTSNFLTSKATISISLRTEFHGISYNRASTVENPNSPTPLSVLFIPLKKRYSARVDGVTMPV
jgi:hypothetical protein